MEDVVVDNDSGTDVNETMQRISRHSQQGVWSGWHHAVPDEETSSSEDGDHEMELDTIRLDDDDWEWDDDEPFTGLTALDQLGEEFERNAAANGDLLR